VNTFTSFDGIRIAYHDEGKGPAVREHLLPLRRRTSGSGCARHLAGPEVECSEVASSVFNIG